MTDIERLRQLSADYLLQELRAREAKAGEAFGLRSLDDPSDPGPLELSADLRVFDDATIYEALIERQKVIYDVDDREDVRDLPAGPNLDDVDSVVALFFDTDVIASGNGTSTLRTKPFCGRIGINQTPCNLCDGERFRGQPTGAFGSGCLVAPDIIATAGHCADDNGEKDVPNVTNVRFVFGFRMGPDAETAETVVENAEVYSGVNIIGRQRTRSGPDWSLVRIDRRVTNHRIARIRRAGKIGDTQAVHVIGHPSGLPTKFAGGAAVRDNKQETFFTANLDTYGGNSGSPVFNSDTHEVEGLQVRGDRDFVLLGDTCCKSLVCPDTGCRGEDCTRTTEFAHLVP